MKITVNEKIDLKADRKKDQFLADMKKARTSNGWEVIDDGWASEGEVKGLYSVYCSEDTELPDIVPDSQMEAIADILRGAISKDPTVRKYSDYVKADAFFDGAVYVNVSFEPTEELWQEELSDAEYVWKKVANAMASIAERYRSRGAELEKQTQGKGESKAAPKKGRSKKSEGSERTVGSWFELKGQGVSEERVYDWFSDTFPDEDVITYDPDPVGGSADDACGIELDFVLSVDEAESIFNEWGGAIERFAINERS